MTPIAGLKRTFCNYCSQVFLGETRNSYKSHLVGFCRLLNLRFLRCLEKRQNAND